jgi:hypothetical protein
MPMEFYVLGLTQYDYSSLNGYSILVLLVIFKAWRTVYKGVVHVCLWTLMMPV